MRPWEIEEMLAEHPDEVGIALELWRVEATESPKKPANAGDEDFANAQY